MLYVDIPTESEIIALASSRDDLSVSIYLPTTPLSQEAASDSVQLKNLAKESLRKLTEKEADKGRVAALSEHFDALIDDPEFWRFQANSLAVLATPDNIQTFRVASALSPIAVVSDRFFLKPLLRAVSFSNSCYVLALAEGAVRLIEVSADLPASALKVDSLPRDARNVTGRSLLINRSMGRVQGGRKCSWINTPDASTPLCVTFSPVATFPLSLRRMSRWPPSTGQSTLIRISHGKRFTAAATG